MAEMMPIRMLCVGAYSLRGYGLLYRLQGVVILHKRLGTGLKVSIIGISVQASDCYAASSFMLLSCCVLPW